MGDDLKARLRADLTAAMKSHDQVAAATIRMALTAITNAEVAGPQAKVLGQDEVVAVLVKEAKRRDEAAEAFRAAGRAESAAREEAEGEVLRAYLPTPLTADEVEAMVAAAVAQAEAEGLSGGRAMGAVMAALKPATAGRTDGAVLASTVRRQLGPSR